MKKFACPVCHQQTKVYSKDRRYITSANVVLRYRLCPECGNRFMTKEDLDDQKEILFRTLSKRPKELLGGTRL